MKLLFSLLADCVVVLHLGYMLFAVGSEILIIIGKIKKWKWVYGLWFRILHLASVVIVAVEALVKFLCPLTSLENYLRQLAGQKIKADMTFFARLIHSFMFIDFQPWFYTTLYVGFCIVVLITFIWIPPKLKRK